MKNLTIACICIILAGCGGGGGGGSSSGGVVPVVPPITPTSFNFSGTVNTTGAACDGVAANCAPTGVASGFSVVLGSMPTGGNGGSPVAPVLTATTDSSGHFALASVPSGTYEIQIGKDSTFATLHAKVVVNASGSVAYTISALSPVGRDSFGGLTGEQNWFTSVNAYRAQSGASAIGADEFAMEANRAYAEYLEANHTTIVCKPFCPSFGQFAQQYQAAGGLFTYSDSYRLALIESDCPSFAEQDATQGPMLKAAAARFGGYGFRGTGGSCVFSAIAN